MTGIEGHLPHGWSENAVHVELNRQRGLQLVAYEDSIDVAIGWCCGFWLGEEAELLRIAVALAKRKCGVASALLAQFENECQEQEVTSIFLEVAGRNTAARRLYKKSGYSQVGRRAAYYSKPLDDALVMNKLFSRYDSGEQSKAGRK